MSRRALVPPRSSRTWVVIRTQSTFTCTSTAAGSGARDLGEANRPLMPLSVCASADERAGTNARTPGQPRCETAPVSRDLERAVKQARKRLAQDYGSREAWATLRDAERRLAESRNEAWA